MVETCLPEDFVEALAGAVRSGAELADALEGRVRNYPKTGEASRAKAALTLADTEVQELLLTALHGRFAQVVLEAEEDTPGLRAFSQKGPGRVVIDPIDGTLHSYLEGQGPYAIIAGLALQDRYEAALVGLPREGLFFDAVRGQGARRARKGENSQRVRVDEARRGPGGRILLSYGMPKAVEDFLHEAGYQVGYGCGGALAVAPLIPDVCGAVRWCPGKGVSTRGRVGLLIAREAGACVCGMRGAAFPDNLDEKAEVLFVAANDDVLATLSEAFALAEPT